MDKHIKIDDNFIWEKLLSKDICIEFVEINDQLEDLFTKSLRAPQIEIICSKLSTYNLYDPTRGGVLE